MSGDRIAPSEQFRTEAKALADATTLILTYQSERDACAIRVAEARGALLTAEQELTIRERALKETRDFLEPQFTFHLSVLRTEAEDNRDALRAAREVAA